MVLRGLVGFGVLVLAVSGSAAGFAQVSARLVAPAASEVTMARRTDVPQSIELAQAFTAALNAHDVDAVVELFTDEDAGPTVNADRYAWGKFEIRLWGLRQVRAGYRITAYDYWETEHGAAWTADAYRHDWLALGLTALPVTNSIWVHRGRVADFTSRPREAGDVVSLGRTWRPGAAPEREEAQQ